MASSNSSTPDPSSSEGQLTPWQRGGERFKNKRSSEYFDPCQDAADRSLRCLRRNGGDKSLCGDYFEAYKECKKSWMEEMKREKKAQGKSWFS